MASEIPSNIGVVKNTIEALPCEGIFRPAGRQSQVGTIATNQQGQLVPGHVDKDQPAMIRVFLVTADMYPSPAIPVGLPDHDPGSDIDPTGPRALEGGAQGSTRARGRNQTISYLPSNHDPSFTAAFADLS